MALQGAFLEQSDALDSPIYGETSSPQIAHTTLPQFSPVVHVDCQKVIFSRLDPSAMEWKCKNSTPAGFEPALTNETDIQIIRVCRLNHSAKVS